MQWSGRGNSSDQSLPAMSIPNLIWEYPGYTLIYSFQNPMEIVYWWFIPLLSLFWKATKLLGGLPHLCSSSNTSFTQCSRTSYFSIEIERQWTSKSSASGQAFSDLSLQWIQISRQHSITVTFHENSDSTAPLCHSVNSSGGTWELGGGGVDMLVTAGGFKHDRGSMVIEIYILRLLRVKNDEPW